MISSQALKVFSLIFLTLLTGCNNQVSKDYAMNYYEKIKYDNLVPCMELIMQRNAKFTDYLVVALDDELRIVPPSRLNDLNVLNNQVRTALESATSSISAIEDIGDNASLKAESLIYLSDLKGFEQSSFVPATELLHDRILDSEIAQLQEKLSKVTEMKSRTSEFEKVEFKFLKEFKISNEEVGEINKKYDLDESKYR